MRIDADTVAGFTGAVLAKGFDNPAPIPAFHYEMWELCSSEYKYVAIAAPRGHAKSTAINFAWLLAVLLFREKRYALIVSDTEGQAIQFLQNIRTTLEDNEDLQQIFGKPTFIKDAQADVIVRMKDGHTFRIIAKGSEQKVRGGLWNGLRPDVIVCDDLENDEIVMNKERREKFKNWFFKALMPALSDHGVVRVVGTILHLDSLLENLLNDSEWQSKRYRAHNEDFSNILWPSKWPRERLERERRSYHNQGIPEGYAQEYLNYPIDEENAYFRKEDFEEVQRAEVPVHNLTYYVAIDFAISEKEHADFTVIAVVGVDPSNNLYVVDIRRGRWDGLQIINELFSVVQRFDPELIIAEDGQINKALGSFVKQEMMRTGVFFSIMPMTPIKDKQTRARALQGRMRAGTVYFPEDASWYPDLKTEMMQFPRSAHDDQVDALAWVGVALKNMVAGPTNREIEEEEWEDEYFETTFVPAGRSHWCGY